MVEYSHFERSAPCASPGYYVGRKDAEVKIADGSGYLYGAGTKIAGASGRLFQAGNALTKYTTGGMYNKSAPTVSDGSMRISGGTFSCSRHASIDTGLTTVYAAVLNIVGRVISGKIATLDKIATPDTLLGGVLGHPTKLQYRIKSGKYLQVFTYHMRTGSTDRGAFKRALISWIALGT
jgi:hypothetical protein